jgi:hypothetical protein
VKDAVTYTVLEMSPTRLEEVVRLERLMKDIDQEFKVVAKPRYQGNEITAERVEVQGLVEDESKGFERPGRAVTRCIHSVSPARLS